MAVSVGTTCRAYRTRAGLRQIDIAVLAGVSHTTISHFEQGDWWARDTDAIVAAYSLACEVPVREVWQGAVDLLSGD